MKLDLRWSLLLTAALISTCSVAQGTTIQWTAPGDDGNVGTAAEYDLRYAADSTTLIGWTGATRITDAPPPSAAGTAEEVTVTLPNGVWYVAIMARDEAFNWSPLSNIARVEIDTTAPAAIIDLRVGP